MPDDKNLNNGGQSNGGAGAGGNNQQNQNGQGGSGDGAGAGKGGNDSGGAGNGQNQGGKKDDNAGAGDETVTIKKSEWEKTNKDLEVYRERVTGKKAGEFSLDQNKNDNAGGGNNGGAPAALDEKKVVEIATKTAQAHTHKANEKSAIKEFLKTHIDYTDEKEWQQLITYLPGNINKEDPTEIINALEDAVLAHKRRTGKLDQYLAERTAAARREAEMNAQVNLGFGAGGNGQQLNRGNQTGKVAESTVEMGKRFGHDEAKIKETLAEVPAGPEGGFQIDVMKKPAKK